MNAPFLRPLYSARDCCKIMETCDRRIQIVRDLNARTAYDRQCHANAIAFLQDMNSAAAECLDYVNGEEGFEGAPERLAAFMDGPLPFPHTEFGL